MTALFVIAIVAVTGVTVWGVAASDPNSDTLILPPAKARRWDFDTKDKWLRRSLYVMWASILPWKFFYDRPCGICALVMFVEIIAFFIILAMPMKNDE